MGKGFVVALVAVLCNGVIGYFFWPLILQIYPEYGEILQGFTYNGHSYIAAMVFLSLAVCLWAYRGLRKEPVADLVVAPIFIWLGICLALAVYLPGASFLIVPVFALLAAFLVLINQAEPNPFILFLFSIPAIFILAPLIQMFPVGLGLKMLITSSLLTTLCFFFVLPFLARLKIRWQLGWLCFLLFAGFLAAAHLQSGFTPEAPRPSSLLYVLDADKKTARWVTYDQGLTEWTSQFIPEQAKGDKELDEQAITSKYGSGFTYSAEAPLKAIDAPLLLTMQDTVLGETREIILRILPQRMVNRLEIYTNATPIKKATVNGVPLSASFLGGRKGHRLVTHYISDNSPTELQLNIPAGETLELTVYEASNDLLYHPLFTVPGRPPNQIPKPFVLNDAILVKKTVRFE